MLAKGLAVLCALAVATGATRAEEAAWEALAAEGTAAILRHAIAPGYSDPADFDIDRCETQRNLDRRGRAQARALGAEFRARGIRADRVISSAWCRCRETAELMGLGPVEVAPMLNSFFEDRSTAEEQTAALRAYLEALPPEERVVIVTHQVNITALTGRAVSSGETFVIETGDRAGTVLGAILIRP